MNEPFLQSDAKTGDARLWDKAPAWRTLTVTASLLTLAAVATPLLLPGPPTPVPPMITTTAGKMLVAPPTQMPQPALQNSVALAAPTPAPAPIHHHAVAAPAAQPATACALTMTAAPHPQSPGTVVAFVNPTESAVLLRQTEQMRGGQIDPAYRNNPRVILRGDNGQLGRFSVPAGMQVAIGDRVTVQSAYRNMALPCNFVPFMLTADLGPAPRAQATPPAAGDSAPQTENIPITTTEGKAPVAPP